MNNSKSKLIILFIFLALIIGGGYLLSRRINRNGVKKTGFKTEYNPNYIDSAVRAKSKKENK